MNVDGQDNGNGGGRLCASWLAEASWKWDVGKKNNPLPLLPPRFQFASQVQREQKAAASGFIEGPFRFTSPSADTSLNAIGQLKVIKCSRASRVTLHSCPD